MSTNETVNALPEVNVTPPQRRVLKRGDLVKAHKQFALGLDEETGLPVVATVELPGDQGRLTEQDGDRVIRVVYSEQQGYLLCPPGTRPAVAEQPEDYARMMNETPFQIGQKPGDRITIGRRGLTYAPEGKEPFLLEPGKGVTGSLTPLLNDYVSGDHVVFDVLPDASLQVTDLSSNGTAVELPTV